MAETLSRPVTLSGAIMFTRGGDISLTLGVKPYSEPSNCVGFQLLYAHLHTQFTCVSGACVRACVRARACVSVSVSVCVCVCVARARSCERVGSKTC